MESQHNSNYYDQNNLPCDDNGKKEMCTLVFKEMCTIVDKPGEQQNKSYGNEQQNDSDSNASIVNKDVSSNNAITNNQQFPITNRPQISVNRLPAIPKVQNTIGQQSKNIWKMKNGVFDSDLPDENSSSNEIYEIMREFISNVNILYMNGRFLLFNGRYYEEYSAEDIKSIFFGMFRKKLSSNKLTFSFISSIIELTRIEPQIRISDNAINTRVIVFENGVLDICTGTFLPFSPEYIVTYCVKSNYIPNNDCNTPYFDSYLYKLTGGDSILMERILQVLGYAISPDNKAKVLILLNGVSGSGKSVLIKFLEKILSDKAFFPIQSDKLKGQFALSELFGRTLCVMQDMPNEALDMKAVSILKAISGNDTISSDVKFKSAVSFQCRAKIILTSNFAVMSKSRDDAFYSRLLCVPCKYAVPREEQNPNLIDFLLAEKDAIITKAIQAYFRLVQNNYIFAGNYPPNSAIDFDSYSVDSELNIYNFTMSMFEPDPEGFVFTEDAYDMYTSRNPHIARNNFSEIYRRICFQEFGVTDGRRYKKFINERGEEEKTKNALRCIIGIRLKREFE